MKTGIVIIGRNEGQRFQLSLASALAETALVVYVDSGSYDGSQDHARDHGALVVELDPTQPFTAARARNAGLAKLSTISPSLELVQFIDGDCQLVAGWMTAATRFLDAHPEVAVVCGRRRELHPAASRYNRLCDIEWNTPVGRVKACGGDALIRVTAILQVGGYRDTLIAGEEPELCLRLRSTGWEIHRLADDMTLHDAAMTSFVQWWHRSRRTGHAFAEGYALHGAPPELHYRREAMRPLIWTVAIPLSIAAACAFGGPPGLLLLVIYPAQVVRQALRAPPGTALRWVLPAFQLIGKFAELQGELTYWFHRRTGRRAALIEYKR